MFKETCDNKQMLQMFQLKMLVYECLMLMLMLCKSSYARLTPKVLQLVCISFLSTLSCLQMTLNKDDLLSSLLDELWPKVSVVSHFNPIKWRPAFLSI